MTPQLIAVDIHPVCRDNPQNLLAIYKFSSIQTKKTFLNTLTWPTNIFQKKRGQQIINIGKILLRNEVLQ